MCSHINNATDRHVQNQSKLRIFTDMITDKTGFHSYTDFIFLPIPLAIKFSKLI